MDSNPEFKKRKRVRLFIKAFCVTIAFFLALFFAGWLTLRLTVKPPVITQDSFKSRPSSNDDFSQPEAAFVIPEAEHEDTLIGDNSPAPEGFTPADRKLLFYTFLIFGIDEGVNTDTIMLAAYDGVSHKAYIVGIPRDGKVSVKRSLKKINAAYPVGTLNGGGRDGGIDQLRRELKTVIGFMPDYYVSVDFKAFIRLVDAVKGIEIEVPFDMVYDDPYQNLHINLTKGLHLLDGAEALKFARYRRGNNAKNNITDYQRIENQQAVIKAVAGKLLTPSTLFKIPELIDIFSENVYTNISISEMAWFADQLKDIAGTDALEAYTMPTTGTSGPPSYYELFDEAALLELINATINPYVKDIEAKDLDIAE